MVKFNERFHRDDGQLSLAREVINTDESVVLVSPTGSGKTEIGYLAAADALAENPDGQVIVTTPNRRVRDQWMDRAQKYGLSEQLLVSTNPSKDEVGPGYQRGGAYGRRHGTLRNDWASRKERAIMREQRESFHETKRKALESDIVLTTSPQLRYDLGNRREVAESLLDNISLTIVDEGADVAAYSDETNETHRVSRYFDELLDGMNPDARVLALTAYPGSKHTALESILGAETIKPSAEVAERMVPAVNTYVTPVEDEMVASLSGAIEDKTTQLKRVLVNRLNSDGGDYSIKNLNMGFLAGVMNNKKDPGTAKLAGSIMSAVHTNQRLLEAPLASFNDRDDGRLAFLENVAKYSDSDEEFLASALRKRHREGSDLGKPDYLTSLPGRIPGQGVFAFNYPSSARHLHDMLEDDGKPTSLLTGENRDDHDDELNTFKQGETRFMVLTHSAGGYGLDFPNAEAVVFGGLPNSIEGRVQTRGRVTRSPKFGEPGRVDEHIPVYRGTSEGERSVLKDVSFRDLPGRVVDANPLAASEMSHLL